MQQDIIDNISVKLIEVLKEKLRVSKRARFAVGWLFLSGFEKLKEEIDQLEKLEILASPRTNRQTAEVLLLEKKWEEKVADTLERTKFLNRDKKKEILKEESRGLIEHLSYVEPTQQTSEFLKWFLEKLRERKIEIRIYTKEPLHAKLYLFEYKDRGYGLGEAILGSSNFSLSGFSLNTELNARILGDENYKYLNDWFEKRWQDSLDTDFTPSAQEAIEKSWAFNKDVTPFRIYLRVLHEIFTYQEPEPEIEIEAELFRFQKDAVIDAYRKLKKFNGVFIADVPGLGKTYIGAALLSHLETEGKTAIVISPPRLVEYWREVLDDLAAVKAKVFSLGRLDEVLNNEKYLKRKVVLVDESHHFRNPDTLRYRNLAKICDGKEVILLSATPQNLSIWDIYYQLKLFTPYETNHNFRIYPIHLKEYFKECERGNSNIEDLITQIFIRRTRSDIKEYYPDQKIVFPERKGPYRIDYSIDKVYEGGLYKKLNELINKLTFARYNLANYARPEEFDPDEFQRLRQAWVNLQQLIRVNLNRRLESSVQALKDSLATYLRAYEAFKEILIKEDKVWIGDVDQLEEVAQMLIEDEKEGEEIDEIREENFYAIDKFDFDRLREDLDHDIGIFKQMQELIKDIGPEDDDKLQTLIQILNKAPIKGRKVIIFSAFKSTVQYIYENLKNKFEKVDYIFGGEKILTKIKRFAPKANKASIRPDEEIQILVATEVLSEGLNLQDGQVVINYELHWNPVRIIQRIGRIDRIGSEHDEIYVYNFFPETSAEETLGIEERVTRRIDEIINNFGYDEKTIRLNEQTVRKKLFEIYTEKPEGLEEIEEKSSAKDFENEFMRLKKQYPEEYQKAAELPAMVNIARFNKNKGLVVFCRSDDYFRLKLVDFSGRIISSDDWEILKILKCTPDEKGEEFDAEHFEVVERVRRDFENEANKRESDKQSIIDPVKKEFESLIKWLKRRASREVKQRLDRLLNFVISKQLNFEQSRFLRNVARTYKKKFGLKTIEILEELEKKIYPELDTAATLIKPEIEQKYAQIIIVEELR